MPTAAEGSLGSLEYPQEDRQDLARRSSIQAPSFSDPERNEVARRLFDTIKSRNKGKEKVIDADDNNRSDSAMSVSEDSNGQMTPTGLVHRKRGSSEKEESSANDVIITNANTNYGGGIQASSIKKTAAKQKASHDYIETILLYLIYAIAGAIIYLTATKFI